LTFTRLDHFPRLQHALQVIGTFSLVSFAWIFFRAATIGDGIYIASHLFAGIGNQLMSITRDNSLALMLTEIGYFRRTDWLILAFSVLILEGVQFLQRRGSVRSMISGRPTWQRWALYYGLALAILYLGVFNRSQFIYFQF
jgi:hypothetical protein